MHNWLMNHIFPPWVPFIEYGLIVLAAVTVLVLAAYSFWTAYAALQLKDKP
jgi:hypothetical protein